MCLDQQRNRGWLFEATKKTFSRRLFSKQTNFNNICNIFEQIDYKAALTICCRNCDPRHLFYRLSIPFWIFGFVPEISFFEVTALPSVRRATCVEKLSMECTSWRACGNVLQRTLQEKFRDMCDMCDMSVPRPPILSVLLDAVVASDSSNKPATSVASQVRQMKRVEPCFCVFSICFVATCCMSMHVIACLRRTPFGPLYICYCWSIRHLGMDPSLWKYALPHCRIAVNLVIGFFDLVETLRPQGFGSGCFSPQSSLRLIGPLLFAKLGKSKNCLASSQHVTLHNNTQYAVYLNFSAHYLTCLVWRKNDVKPNFVRILLTQRQRYPAVLESATCLKPWFHETNCCFLVIVLFVFCESTETGIRIDNSDREDNQQELLFPVSNDVLMYLKLQLSYFLLLFI